MLTGKEILDNPFLNKGTAFTETERLKYQLNGLLPTKVQTLTEQVNTTYEQLSRYTTKYEKNRFLMSIYNTNRVLYFAVVGNHIKKLLPVIYTPTIADAVRGFSDNFVAPNDAIYLDVNHPEMIETILKQANKDNNNIEMLIITDGEGVLGIGDWGIQGVMISVGKSAVYTVAAGINPQSILPIVIDNGTNRQELIDNPNYLGNKQPRKTGAQYWDYIDQFVKVAKSLFPKALFHWEDFGRDNASVILEKYREEIATFNDDIQGTGVMMAAAMNAVAKVSKLPVTEQKYVVFGGGTAGIGVSDQICNEMVNQGMTREAAMERFYIVDRFGLVTKDQTNLTAGQKLYARSVSEFGGQQLKTLTEVVAAVKPTVLIGTSGQANTFTQKIVEIMTANTPRPAIMPISNPTELQEGTAKDIITWSKGKALVVTGSPSDPVEYNGQTYYIGQANNSLLYPGLGAGIVIAKAQTVTDGMLSAAAHGIADIQDLNQIGASLLPPVENAKQASKFVAMAVVKAALDEEVNQTKITDIETAVDANNWQAKY